MLTAKMSQVEGVREGNCGIREESELRNMTKATKKGAFESKNDKSEV